MRRNEIKGWALQVIERVKRNQPLEDSFEEVKREWPGNHAKTARQIAAHANAARGDEILWLIGVDEHQGVTGASDEELANWYPKVQRCFESEAPLVTDVNVDYEGKTVVALLFETDLAPYVIKNLANSNYLEVPWRKGRRTTSATHNDLLLLLTSRRETPDIEVLAGTLKCIDPGENTLSEKWELSLRLYVVPNTSDLVVIPFHRCSASFVITPFAEVVNFPRITLKPPIYSGSSPLAPLAQRLFYGQTYDYKPKFIPGDSLSKTIDYTNHEVVIRGAGVLNLTAATTLLSSRPHTVESTVKLECNLGVAHRAGAIVFQTELGYNASKSDPYTPDETIERVAGRDRSPRSFATWTVGDAK